MPTAKVVLDVHHARRVLADQPFSSLLDAELVAFRSGYAELALPLSESARQHQGIAHGGVIAYLADVGVTFAAGSIAGSAVRTVDLAVNFLSAACGHRLVARANVIHEGARLVVARCDLFDIRDEGERRCAAAQGTVAAR